MHHLTSTLPNIHKKALIHQFAAHFLFIATLKLETYFTAGAERRRSTADRERQRCAAAVFTLLLDARADYTNFYIENTTI